MLIEARRPLCVKLSDGVLHLRPGHPVELDDAQATKLLAKAPDAVRIHSPTSHVPAPHDDDVIVEPGPGRSAFWESPSGVFRTGLVTLLGRTRDTDGLDRFWVWIESEGDAGRWVHESLLRTKAAYEAYAQQAATPGNPGETKTVIGR